MVEREDFFKDPNKKGFKKSWMDEIKRNPWRFGKSLKIFFRKSIKFFRFSIEKKESSCCVWICETYNGLQKRTTYVIV